MSTSFKNVTPTGPGGTATLLIVLSFTGFLLLTQSLFVVPSGQVAVPPGPVGVTFLKDVDIKFYLYNQSYLNRLISALVRHLIKIFF